MDPKGNGQHRATVMNASACCQMHPIIEGELERVRDKLDVFLDDLRDEVEGIRKDQGAIRIMTQQTADHMLALAQRFDDSVRSAERINEVRREDVHRRLAALESESSQWREDTQSQTRDALIVRAKRAETHVEELVKELRKERDLSAKREEQLTTELRLERARRDSMRAGETGVRVERWKALAVLGVAVVSSLAAIAQMFVK